jgi:hypothetical protein
VKVQAVNDAFANGKLSRGSYTEWLQKAMVYQNAPDKILEASSSANDVKVIAAKNGMQVGAGSSATDEAQLAYLTFQVDHAILAQEQSTGKKLDQNAKDKIISDELVKIKTTTMGERSWVNPARWFGSPFSFSTEDPAYLYKTLDITGAPDIPADTRSAIITESKRNGIQDPTEEQIQKRYALLQRTGK